MDEIPSSHIPIPLEERVKIVERINRLICQFKFEDDQYIFENLYMPSRSLASRVFPWRIASGIGERAGKEHRLLDEFIEIYKGDDNWVFWFDDKWGVPKPVFTGLYNSEVRNKFYSSFLPHFDLGIVSMTEDISIYSYNDLDYTIVSCPKKIVGDLDKLFGGHAEICRAMKKYINEDEGFNWSEGRKAWGTNHLLPLSGC